MKKFQITLSRMTKRAVPRYKDKCKNDFSNQMGRNDKGGESVFNLVNRVTKNRKGFTLVELMVVVLIIGILVAIAIPLYSAARETAMKNSTMANLRMIKGSMAQYQAKNGGETLPTDIKELVNNGLLSSIPIGPGNATYSISGNMAHLNSIPYDGYYTKDNGVGNY